MSQKNYPTGVRDIQNQSIDFINDTIIAIVVNESHTFDRTHDFVDDIVANEVSGTGYARKTLANKSISNSADISVSSITRSGTTATVTTASAHNAKVGHTVLIEGAAETAYNGYVTVTAVGSDTTFDYEVAGSPSTPATGTILYNWNRVLFKADDLTFSGIDVSPDKMAEVILAKEVTNDADSPLISNPNIPVIDTIGVDITIKWPAGHCFAIEINPPD